MRKIQAIVLVAFAVGSANASETIDDGGEIYREHCSVCHGDRGSGAVWARDGLSPRPADFTDPALQARLTRDHMIHVVSYGRPETAMAGWKTRLGRGQIEAVVDYVIDSFMPAFERARDSSGDTHAHHEHDHAHSHDDSQAAIRDYLRLPLPDALRGDAARGGELYRANCATCHGETGDGRGPRAYFINPKPRNFLHPASRVSYNRPTLYRLISDGRLRSEMPAWSKVMSPQQIADISEYVFTAFIENDQ